MTRIGIGIIVLAALFATGAPAQPTLDSLWPNTDGLRFSYQYTYGNLLFGEQVAGPAWLQLEGFVTTPGGQAQVLLGGHPLPPAKSAGPGPSVTGLLAQVWRARPDLRAKIAQCCVTDAGKRLVALDWWPTLLHTGYFMKSPEGIVMWQEAWNHATWTYLEDEISVGASFTRQLLPELADDIFLHGTVVDVDATVTTGIGVIVHAVKVDYVVDYGVQTSTDEDGNALGLVHSETRGHVHYAPGIGPVEMLERYLPYVWMDCGGEPCPPEWVQWAGEAIETQTLSLTELPVASEVRSWGGVKSMYR